MNLNTLIKIAESKAIKTDDGHLSILRFTTGWIVLPDTVDSEDLRALRNNKPYKTLKAALVAYIIDDVNLDKMSPEEFYEQYSFHMPNKGRQK